MQYKKIKCLNEEGETVKAVFIGHKGTLSIQIFNESHYANYKGNTRTVSTENGPSIKLTSEEAGELLKMLEETRIDNMLGI